ncbi:hypothetical protein AVEN_157050-1, partial [Araneus ventricosus]
MHCTHGVQSVSNVLSKFFVREESHMGRDHGTELIVEIPECDVLTSNLTPGARYETDRDGALTTWPCLPWEISNACNNELRTCA